MTSPFERRLSKAEAASAAGAEAHLIGVATPELAESLWAAAISQGRSPGPLGYKRSHRRAIIDRATATERAAYHVLPAIVGGNHGYRAQGAHH